ncbi:M42 family metallopeptidase [Microaceticoccus formicicus]|uniref:M42 family metallopeptidase n=1 Tax=Microaceticoccus formicicus TaxID=3118105 RepID=UPI003CD04890|nr:M20/M25/M40 family metallo-hydrolase [Peptoniphilaceae bacterium AMB_02]
MSETEKLSLIGELSDAMGAPGFEDEVNSVIEKYIGDFSYQTDVLKNAYINLNEESENLVMLDAHSDEVGFIVRFIEDNGLISFLPLGGWVDSAVSAQAVYVRGNEGYHKGIVVTKPVHFMTDEERGKTPTIDEMRIDLGGYTKSELADLGIEVGNPIVPAVKFEFNASTGVMMGKAFDNRLGCAAVVETMKALGEIESSEGVVGAIAVQEEVGGRGAKITARKVNPKYAIMFEGSPSDDLYVPDYAIQCRMGGGSQIRHYDGSYISDESLIKLAKESAAELGIKLQHAVRKGSGTNAGIVHVENLGIPCLVIGIPSRYIHSHYSYASLQDFKDTVKLAVSIILKLKAKES